MMNSTSRLIPINNGMAMLLWESTQFVAAVAMTIVSTLLVNQSKRLKLTYTAVRTTTSSTKTTVSALCAVQKHASQDNTLTTICGIKAIELACILIIVACLGNIHSSASKLALQISGRALSRSAF